MVGISEEPEGTGLHPTNTQEMEIKEFILASVQFVFSVSYIPGSPAQGMVPPMVKMGLPTSINRIKITSHSLAQRTLSQVIVDSIKSVT